MVGGLSKVRAGCHANEINRLLFDPPSEGAYTALMKMTFRLVVSVRKGRLVPLYTKRDGVLRSHWPAQGKSS